MSDSTTPKQSEVEVQQKALNDLSSLGRVSHKLAMTEGGAPFEKVLTLLLPRLLSRVGTNRALQQEYSTSNNTLLKETLGKIHNKLVETFSHIMQRVRNDASVQLPVEAILLLLYDDNTYTPKQVDVFTMNLTLTFLNLGVTRCSYKQVTRLLPGLLVLRSQHSGIASQQGASLKAQSHQIAHLLLKVVERIVTEERVSAQVSSPPSSSTLRGSKLTETTNTVSDADNDDKTSSMEISRKLCRDNDKIASSVFDLFMDCILYQPSASQNMPPPGLSQAGHELLLSNKEWSQAMLVSSRLKDFKIALLNFIIPTRRWSLFMNDEDEKGIARTVALLVAASGDAHADVVERATLSLKAHLDTKREKNDITQAAVALGDAIALSCTLLSLIVGDSHAQAALSAIEGLDSTTLSLGTSTPNSAASQEYSSQVLLSLKRRMASDQTAAAIMTFVSNKVLNDNPLLLDTAGTIKTRALGSLAISSASKLLAARGTSTLSTLRAAPYIAAAQLLSALTIRLTTLPTFPPIDLLLKSMATVCNVLSQAATPRPSPTPGTFEGSIAMRDACYGVVSTCSRSQFCRGFIFTLGKDNDSINTNYMDTAKLLFACASNEEETLRPRAVAALDALLGAYCRVYVVDQNEKNEATSRMEIDGDVSEMSNPWSQAASTVSDAKRNVSSSSDTAMRDTDGLARALLPLLWSAAQSSQPKASRVAAARWSSDLLKALSLSNACHILCFLAGDKDVTAASIAREGLGLDKTIGEDYDEHQVGSQTLPDFTELALVLFSETSTSHSTSSSWRPRYFDFSYHGKAAALRFGLVCLLSDLYGGEDDAVALYVNALSKTLRHFGTASGGRGSAHGRESIDLLDESAICLAGTLSTSRFARSMIVSGRAPIGLEDMEALAILADSSKARRFLAEACGHIYEDQFLWQSAPAAKVGLDEWVEKSQILRALKSCAKQLTDMQTELFQIGEVHGAAFLGARCCRAFRLLASTRKAESSGAAIDECWDSMNSIIEALGKGSIHSDEIIGNAFSQGLSIALSYDGVDAPILDSRLYAGTTTALTLLDAALRKYGNGDHTDETRASSLALAAGVVLAASTSAAGYVSDESTVNQSVGPARILCVDALFNLIGSNAFRKDPEVALVAGEALANYADAYGPNSAVWSSVAGDWPGAYSEDYANNLPPHQQVLYVLLRREINVSSPHKRTAAAPALLAIVGRAARLANSDKELAKRVLVVEVVRHLAEIQTAFIKLLADPKSKQLSRESCCIGLAACQGIAQAVAHTEVAMEMKLSDRLNDSLLRAFGQTTNFGGSAMMETSAQNAERRRQNNEESDTGAPSITEPFGIETEVGGAAGLGEAALGAYREMAAAALALGRSDVLYALFLLSISHPVWFSSGTRDRYSASSLLGDFSLIGSRTNSAEMREALRPHLSKLIPRMLRACHDPNKQTRELMNTLWIGVTGGGAESRKAITENLLPTIDILMEDASSKLWRARVGACGALAEVIVGRSWNDLGGGPALLDEDDIFTKTSTFSTTAAVRLLRLWRVSMRALDDVRLSVRESGETLVRSVRSLTCRLCDPAAFLTTSTGGVKPTPEEQREAELEASAAATTCLRWLVKHGLNQPCAEAVGACVSCLLGIVEVVQPITLEPVLSELIGALLMAMSGLEPAALNYLQVRSAGRDSGGAESYERLERARLQMASSGPIAGALNKCLDMVPSVELSVQKEVVPQLDSALRSGVGFATRAATADAVSSLCTASPGAFNFPGHGNNNPTVRLLRALYYASEREKGQGARDKMAHALGNLAAISPGQSVRSLALRACERYTGATGNNDDPAARRAAAAALRALAVRASNQLADGGPRDIWCKKVLPLAFLGQRDSEKKVASLWKEVWDEGGVATHVVDEASTRTSNFGVLLEEKLLPDLIKACVDALNDVSWVRRVAACSALAELCNQNILAPVARSTRISPDSLTSSDELLRSKRRAQASQEALNACIRLMVKPRVWTGKADVVKAATKIAGQWVVVCSESDVASLGWDGKAEICSWMPLSGNQENFGKDLFVGDAWFDTRHTEMEMELSEVENDERLGVDNGGAMQEDAEMSDANNGRDDAKIDFEKGDDILTSDTEAEEIPSRDEASSSATFAGLCKALLEQAFPRNSAPAAASLAEDVLPYKAASLAGLSDCLQILSGIPNPTTSLLDYQIALYRMIAPTLLPVVGNEMYLEAGDNDSKKAEPPLIVARSIDCVAAALWRGIGKDSKGDHPEEDMLSLSGILRTVGGSKQPAWTVRESSVLCSASLASKCSVQVLRNPRLVDNFLESSKYALGDRKFWRVRLAALELLLALVKRAGDKSGGNVLSMTSTSGTMHNRDEQQLALEALLPHKEMILQLGKSALNDSEATVTSKASDVCGALAWWP